MAENSGIEWTDHTFNPWIGCTKVSPGCDHCYAEGVSARFKITEWGAGQPRKRTSVQNWNQVRRWNSANEKAGTRQRVFCASLADVFDNEVPQEWRDDLWRLIRECKSLDWILLTKRIGNANKMLPFDWEAGAFEHCGVMISVVNQEEADRDIPKLLNVRAAWRGLSMEPLLDEVDISEWLFPFKTCDNCPCPKPFESQVGLEECCRDPELMPSRLDWVIVGGESGTGARAMHPDWARGLRDQCQASSTPFFFKQWGEYWPFSTGDGKQILPWGEYKLPTPDNKGFGFLRKGKKASGSLLDGREWKELPTQHRRT